MFSVSVDKMFDVKSPIAHQLDGNRNFNVDKTPLGQTSTQTRLAKEGTVSTVLKMLERLYT